MRWILLLLCGGLGACHSPTPVAVPAGPYVVVLGTAQDAGAPQIGCREACCAARRRDPARRRLVTSLLLVDPRSGERWLFDATPDLPLQVERMAGHPPGRRRATARPPLVDGVFLTHAHMGHYGGLLQLGPEAYAARRLKTYVTDRMGRFLAENGPWSLLVEREHLVLHRVMPGGSVTLAPDLKVDALRVPHREEFSDTVAWVIRGPTRSLLYLPDIDKWERWDQQIEDWIEAVDFALLDGSFYADGEIPGRAMADIPHPFIVESVERFRTLPAAQRDKVYFTHLNHTNPVAVPGSPARQHLEAAGLHVAEDLAVYPLGAR